MQSLRGPRAFTPSTNLRPQRVSVSKLVVNAKESRVGRYPIPLPKNVQLQLDGQTLKVKVHRAALDLQVCKRLRPLQAPTPRTAASQGPLGSLEWTFNDKVVLAQVGSRSRGLLVAAIALPRLLTAPPRRRRSATCLSSRGMGRRRRCSSTASPGEQPVQSNRGGTGACGTAPRAVSGSPERPLRRPQFRTAIAGRWLATWSSACPTASQRSW
jgi:hypothetical protein